LDSYYLQHPEKKPTNPIEEEIASLVEEERVADLMTA